MNIRITWTGTESDLKELMKSHIIGYKPKEDKYDMLVLRKLVEIHLTLNGRLKHVTIKIENMKYLIYDKSRTSMVIKYINSDGSVTLTNVEADAMEFNTIGEADAIIDTIGGSDFWGTRPTRPHGK